MKIYFDESLSGDRYISFLVPLLGIPKYGIWWEDESQIKKRYKDGKSLLEKSSKDECDYFVYPKYFVLPDWNKLKEYSAIANRYGKKVILFDQGEIDDYIDISDNILWFKRSTLKKNPRNEICIPPFPKDLTLERKFKELGNRDFSVGFVGYSRYSSFKMRLKYYFSRFLQIFLRTKFVRYVLFHFSKRNYHIIINFGEGNYYRGKVIEALSKMKEIKFNFIQREHALVRSNYEDKREEYLENINTSDFCLSVRGFGNYSVRHYEILSAGRIPLYIDTDGKLPFEEEIPYDELFVRVPFRDVDNIETYILNFLKKNDYRISGIGKRIRGIYEEYFVMSKCYRKIISRLEKI